MPVFIVVVSRTVVVTTIATVSVSKKMRKWKERAVYDCVKNLLEFVFPQNIVMNETLINQ